jgi:hypothetical protein
LAERDGIQQGLVWIFSILENCRSFSVSFSAGGRFVRPASRKCLHFYYYFMDRDCRLDPCADPELVSHADSGLP